MPYRCKTPAKNPLEGKICYPLDDATAGRFKAMQRAINNAVEALGWDAIKQNGFTASMLITVDGRIGPRTANVATEVIKALPAVQLQVPDALLHPEDYPNYPSVFAQYADELTAAISQVTGKRVSNWNVSPVVWLASPAAAKLWGMFAMREPK
jgi:hypothetical protein